MVTLRRQLRTNRAIYVRQQLDLCKLGFSIYIATAEGFQRVSPWSFSRTIRPSKINAKLNKVLTLCLSRKTTHLTSLQICFYSTTQDSVE